MRRSRSYAIGQLGELEPRIVLSAGGRLAHAQVTALNDIPRASGRQASRASTLVAAAFDEFRTSYFATLNAYLTPPNNTSMDGRRAFMAATVQSVNLLAQNLIHILLPVNGATQRQRHGQPPLQTFINNRIQANTSTSLSGGLKSATPPMGATVDNDELYVITANNAIDAAEAAVQNGIRILRLGAFGGHK